MTSGGGRSQSQVDVDNSEVGRYGRAGGLRRREERPGPAPRSRAPGRPGPARPESEPERQIADLPPAAAAGQQLAKLAPPVPRHHGSVRIGQVDAQQGRGPRPFHPAELGGKEKGESDHGHGHHEGQGEADAQRHQYGDQDPTIIPSGKSRACQASDRHRAMPRHGRTRQSDHGLSPVVVSPPPTERAGWPNSGDGW